ncbi:hypothetical protein QW131_00760 [Roseibium salinum]|nr:hypothetical protein [Roseibium salinum]
MKDENGNLSIYTSFTQEQLENHPEFTMQAYEENPDSVLLR